MSVSDPIADLLVRLKNGARAEHRYVDVPLSRQKVALIDTLHKRGYVNHFVVNEERRLVRVYLKYLDDRSPKIKHLKRLSSPGCRRYVGADKIPFIQSGKGDVVLSTSSGVMFGRDARRTGVGGELICSIA